MTPEATQTLGDDPKRLVRDLVAQFGEAPQVRWVAEAAGRFLELAERARAELERDGLVLRQDGRAVTHPAVAIERTMRVAYVTAIRVLESPRRGKLGKPPMGEALGRAPRQRAAAGANRFFRSRQA